MALSDKDWDVLVEQYGGIQFMISGAKEVSVRGLRRELDALVRDRDDWKQRWGDEDNAARWAREALQTEREEWRLEKETLLKERSEAIAAAETDASDVLKMRGHVAALEREVAGLRDAAWCLSRVSAHVARPGEMLTSFDVADRVLTRFADDATTIYALRDDNTALRVRLTCAEEERDYAEATIDTLRDEQ